MAGSVRCVRCVSGMPWAGTVLHLRRKIPRLSKRVEVFLHREDFPRDFPREVKIFRIPQHVIRSRRCFCFNNEKSGACIVFDPILVSRVCECPILDKFETWLNKMVVISHFYSSGFVWEWGNCLPKSIIRSFLNQIDPSIVWASHSWTNRCCVIWIWSCPDSLTCSFPAS